MQRQFLTIKVYLLILISLAITVRLLDTNIDVNETDGSVQLCVNVTHGSVESSAYIRYSTISGSARGGGGVG